MTSIARWAPYLWIMVSREQTHTDKLYRVVSRSRRVLICRVYAHKVDIDAIEATASTLLADEKGIDHAVMSQHMLAIQSQAMGKALYQFSERTRSTTLHSRPQHVLLPLLRHSPLPVLPHPALVQHLTAEQKRLRDDHVARIVVPPPREPLIPIEVTASTQKTLGPFNLSMGLTSG